MRGVLLLLALPLSARADVVVTRDGRCLEGKVVEESAQGLVVETPFGRINLARAEVVSIERGPSPRERYEARRASAKGAEDRYRLGLFCREKGLSKEARQEFEEAVRLDPTHEGANRALGRVLFEGKWVTPPERDRLAALREEEAFRARGLVRHEGRWVTPEEREALQRGLVLFGGKWIPEEEAMRAKGFAQRGGRWVPAAQAAALEHFEAAAQATGETLRPFLAEHFAVGGPYEEDFHRGIAEGAERVFAFFDRVFGEGAAAEALQGRKAEIYLFDGRAAYEKAVPHFAAATNTVSPAWVDYTRGAFGFVLYDPAPLSVAARFARSQGTLYGHSLHHVGHILLNLRAYTGTLLPPWYDEGFACLAEYAATQKNSIFCRAPAMAGGGYYRPRFGPKEVEVDVNRLAAGMWREEFARAAAAGVLSPLETVLRREVSELSLTDVVESMAAVELFANRGALGKLHAGFRGGMPAAPTRVLPPRESNALHDAVFGAAAGLDVGGVERAIRGLSPTSAPAPGR